MESTTRKMRTMRIARAVVKVVMVEVELQQLVVVDAATMVVAAA